MFKDCYICSRWAWWNHEISFSKTKLIITCQWSTISQEKLNNLLMLFIENEITKTIDFEMIFRV